MVAKIVKTAWSEIGVWHMGRGAPNGSCPGQIERNVTTVEVFAADHYGHGPKLYMDLSTRTESKDGCWSPKWIVAQDGNEAAIAERMELVGAEV